VKEQLSLTAGKALRLTRRARATVHWSTDGWRTSRDTELADSELGLFLTDLPTERLPVGSNVVFTFFWPEAGRWEDEDFQVIVQ